MDKDKVKLLCDEAIERIENYNIGTFAGMDKPLFLISDTYPGVWTEHIYDSVFYAKLNKDKLYLAENILDVFIDAQTEEGQIPCYIWDGNRVPGKKTVMGYWQIQECVSFAALCFEVYEMSQNKEKLKKYYAAAKAWDGWLRKYRMTLKTGLIEMFCGYDTGHDKSGRLNGISCDGNYVKDGAVQNASVLPPDDGITPIIAVDMNSNFYATEIALSKMATELKLFDEAEKWIVGAHEIKKKLIEICYDEKDAFFYDADRKLKKRPYRSSVILHPFLEGVLDKDEDKEMIDRIYSEHIKNPDEFWTPYPFPSMAYSDPSTKEHEDNNSWGYFTQGLIVLRCSRWMDKYGYSEDYDCILKKWLEAWTEHADELKFGQEIDPISGVPSPCSEWYSTSMLNYIYAAKRLKIV